jgi:hypothetical protein
VTAVVIAVFQCGIGLSRVLNWMSEDVFGFTS